MRGSLESDANGVNRTGRNALSTGDAAAQPMEASVAMDFSDQHGLTILRVTSHGNPLKEQDLVSRADAIGSNAARFLI